MGHLRNRDVARNMHLAVAISGLSGVFIAGRFLWETELLWSPSAKTSDGGKAVSPMALGALLMVIGGGSKVIADLLQLAASRGCELDADLAAKWRSGAK